MVVRITGIWREQWARGCDGMLQPNQVEPLATVERKESFMPSRLSRREFGRLTMAGTPMLSRRSDAHAGVPFFA